MRAILEVQSGSRTGHRMLVAIGQSLEIGRSHLVDLSFPDDARMSGRHFRIHNDGDACRIEDPGSTNGTFVNDQQVQTATLRHDDVVLAGETQFRIWLEADEADTTTVPLAPTSKISRDIPTVPAAAGGAYTLERCPSTVLRHGAAVSVLSPGDLARQLSRSFQTLLIIDPQKLTEETHQQLTEEAQFLFDWLPEEVRATSSPRLLTNLDETMQRQLVDQLWGQDALLCLYSQPGVDPPVAEIRQAAGAFVRPSLLVPQISMSAEPFVRNIMAKIEAILVEQPTADGWALYSFNPLQTFLSSLGLKEAPGDDFPPQAAGQD